MSYWPTRTWRAAYPPTTDQDAAVGFRDGDVWIDLASGSAYYCSDASAGAWDDWPTQGPELDINEHYQGRPTASDGEGFIFYTWLSGSIGSYGSESTAPGIVQFQESGVGAYAQDSTWVDGLRLGGGRLIYEARVKIPTLSSGSNTFQARVGLVGANFPVTNADAIGLYYDTTGQNGTGSTAWKVITSSGGSRTVTTTGTTVATGTWYDYELRVNADASEVLHYLDGTLVATHTTDIPTGQLGASAQLYGVASSGAARQFLIDRQRVRWWRA